MWTRTRHARPRQMPMNVKKLLVQHSPNKRMSKRSAGYSLVARMNVRLHQYDCEHIFLWSTDSRRIVFACLPNIRHISEWRRMLFAYTSTLCVSHAFLHSFRIHVQMWTRLKVCSISCGFMNLVLVSQIWLLLSAICFGFSKTWQFDLFGFDPDSGFSFDMDSQENETCLK